jgi:hypothetical protein
MSLADLIYKNRNRRLATATPATLATVQDESGPSVAKVATVAVANSKNHEAANDPATAPMLPDDCAGALQFPDGESIHWQADQSPVTGSEAALRAELARLSDRVATAMHWDDDERAWLADYAARCPADNLAADVGAYRAQVAALDAELAARDAVRRARERTWTAGDDLRNRGGE